MRLLKNKFITVRPFKFLRNVFVFIPEDGREIIVPNKYNTDYQRELFVCGVLNFRMGNPRDNWTRRNLRNNESKLIFDDGWFTETPDLNP